ncbi:alpha/beta-hydrolase [Trametes elegans]|nr:alpha/beta-hydrolase [Trametes elegans]
MNAMQLLHAAFYALSVVSAALAAPTTKRAGVTALSSSELSSFAPFTQFARAAYCPSSKIKDWKCGKACDALPGFQPTLTGGDGDGIQLFFVGYWPQENSVVVAHEGTDPLKFQSDLTDVNFFLDDLDKSLFPGVKSNVQAHNGFAKAHTKTASTILTEVKKLLSKNNAKQVIVVGHSLGGALAELDSLFLTMQLSSDIHLKAVTYGTPRVGNKAFASLVDSKVPDFVRINNEADLIPIVPGRFLGFQHPQGEIHIVSPGKAVSCQGNDNADDEECTIKTVPNIFEGNILNHLGPYEGISIGTIFCN